jgi:hypothetical protein
MEAPSTDAFTTTADTLKEEKYAFAASADTCKEKAKADHCTASADYWKVLAHSWNALAAEPGSSLVAKLAATLEASLHGRKLLSKPRLRVWLVIHRRHLLHLIDPFVSPAFPKCTV